MAATNEASFAVWVADGRHIFAVSRNSERRIAVLIYMFK
jgi:hypothetical protein